MKSEKVRYYLAGSVALITFAVYLSTLQNGFVGWWDDNAYVVENVHIRSFNGAFFKWIFLEFYSWNWHPLTWISHALDYATWGLNPVGHHLTSILLHSVNTFIVVILTTRLAAFLNRRRKGGEHASLNERAALATGVTAGLLFGLHPLHVESVAWAAERKDLLCALFFLLSIVSYTNYVRADRQKMIRDDVVSRFCNKHYLLALSLFLLALLSKPMAVTLPAVLLILDWHPYERIRTGKAFLSACIEKLPFIVLSAFSSALTILAQKSGGAILSMESIEPSARVVTAFKSLVAYLGKMAWPLRLAPFYPYPHKASLTSFEILFSIVLVVGITALCVKLAKKEKVWLSAWLYYLVTLIPVLGIVQVGGQSMADRYTYLPSIGPFFLAGLLVSRVSLKAGVLAKGGAVIKLMCAGAAIFALAALSYLTYRQIGTWKNGLTLWDAAISKGFESATAYTNRGLAYEEEGRRDRAIADFNTATALDPRNFFAYNNLGVLYGQEGSFLRSIDYFDKSLAANPNHAESYNNRGLSYFSLGQYDRAREDFNRAIALEQNFAMAYLNRGNLFLKIARIDLALADFRQACDLGNAVACKALP